MTHTIQHLTITANDVREGDILTGHAFGALLRMREVAPVTIDTVERATFPVLVQRGGQFDRVNVEHAVLIHTTGRFNLPLDRDVQVTR